MAYDVDGQLNLAGLVACETDTYLRHCLAVNDIDGAYNQS